MKKTTPHIKKQRIDLLLVEKGFVDSREKAKALVMAGCVMVDGNRCDKAGTTVSPQSIIEVKGLENQFVGRGGIKLEGALAAFGVDPHYKICCDVGASTGGFTDCLLQKGAVWVFALDVGYGQLDWSLRSNPKVIVLEKTNIRHVEIERFGTFVDLMVIDVSFISLTKVLVACRNLLVAGGEIVALVKPQFEAGKNAVQKGGVVKSQKIQLEVLEKIKTFCLENGFQVLGECTSSIVGKKKGNTEFFVHLKKRFQFKNDQSKP